MNVEFTGRHYEITPTIRKSVETGLTKIRKILGDKFDTKVILAIEKRRHKAEITISPRNGPLVGEAQAGDMKAAVNEALEHLEKQAVKYKTRWRSKKRHDLKKWNGKEAQQESLPAAIGLAETAGDFAGRTPVSRRRQVHRSTSRPLRGDEMYFGGLGDGGKAEYDQRSLRVSARPIARPAGSSLLHFPSHSILSGRGVSCSAVASCI